MAQYVSGRKSSLSVGFPGITTNNPVLIVDGRVGIQTTLPTADVDLGSIRIRESLADSTGFTGELGYFLTKDSGGLIWTAVPPLNNNAIFVAEDGDIIGVSSFTGINIQSNSPSQVSVSTNTSNSNFADLTINFNWVESENGGLYTSRNIGIGTTVPNVALDVVGDGNFTGVVTASKFFGSVGDIDSIEVIDLKVSGVSTFVGIATFGTVGIGTTNVIGDDVLSIIGDTRIGGDTDTFRVGSAITMSNGIITATTFTGDFLDIKQLDVDNLNVSGVSTFVGIATFGTVGIGTTNVIGDDVLSIIGDTRIGGDTDTFRVGSAITMSNGIITATTFTGDFLDIKQLDVDNLNVSGISTLGFVEINAGIITAKSGIVTYYGDGKYLQNIITNTAENVIGGIASVTSLSVSGISTLGVVEISSGIITNTTAGYAVTVYGDLIGTASTASFATTAFTLNDREESEFNVAFAQTAGIATNIAGGDAGSVPYQSSAGITTFLAGPSLEKKILGYNTNTNEIIWTDVSSAGGVTETVFTVKDEDGALYNQSDIDELRFYGDSINVTTGGTGIASIRVTSSGIATYSDNAGIATNVIGGIASVTSLSVSGISTLGVVKINAGIITATAGYAVTVYGDLIGTASTASFATTSFSLNNKAESELNVAFAQTAGIATNVIGGIASVTSLSVSGISTLGVVKINAGIITNTTAGVPVTVYGDLIGTASTASFATTAFTLNGREESEFNVAFAQTAGIATNIAGGDAGSVPYQSATDTTTFLAAPGVSNQVLLYDNSSNQPEWSKVGLGTNTSGDYVKNIEGTASEIEVTNGSGAGVTAIIGLPDNVIITSNLTVGTDLSVGGNIFIGGTSASLDVNDFRVKDKNAILGFTTNSSGNEVSSDTIGSGGGISIASTVGTPLVDLYNVGIDTLPTTYKRFHWYKDGDFAGLGTDAWLSNYAIGIGTTQIPSGTYFASGKIQFTEDDILGVKNIKSTGISTLGVVEISSGIITNTTAGVPVTVYGDLIGTASTASFATTAFTLNGREESEFNVAFAQTAGIATNVIGGIASVTQLSVSGVSTFESNVDIGTGGTTAFFDVSKGNIGIGSTQPTASLDVIGDFDVHGTARVYGNSRFSLNSGLNETFRVQGDNWDNPLLEVSESGRKVGIGETDFGNNVSLFVSGDLDVIGFSTFWSNVNIGYEGTTAFFDVGSGNIGIGSTQPTATLDVIGTLHVSGISTLGVVEISSGIITNTTAGYAVTVYGDLIGTASTASFATTSFSLNNKAESELNVATATTATNVIGGIASVTSLSVSGIGTFESNVDIGTGGTTAFFDVGSGNIGIGSTQPTATLDVIGTLSVSAEVHVSNIGISTTDLKGNKLQIDHYGINAGVGTFTATAGVINNFNSFRMSDFKTAEYAVFVQTSSSIQSQKVLVMHDNSSAFSQEYAIMFNPDHIVSIGASVSGALCYVSLTPETGVTGLVTYTFTRETMS